MWSLPKPLQNSNLKKQKQYTIYNIRVSFNYSTKNIPVASKKEYIRQLIDKTEQFLCRMRWKAYHFLNPNQQSGKENFGFKTRNNPPVIEELKEFEDGMTKIIQKVKFKNIKCQFQKDLNEDIKSIKSDNRLFVKVDKSTIFYKLESTKYNQLLNEWTNGLLVYETELY